MAYSIYNTPTDNWRCGDLAGTIHALNPRIDFNFSPALNRSDPEAIDGSRFAAKFGFYPMPIKERLRLALENL